MNIDNKVCKGNLLGTVFISGKLEKCLSKDLHEVHGARVG